MSEKQRSGSRDQGAIRNCRSLPLKLSRTEWPLVDGGSLRLLSVEEERELLGEFCVPEPLSAERERE